MPSATSAAALTLTTLEAHRLCAHYPARRARPFNRFTLWQTIVTFLAFTLDGSLA